MQMRKSLGGLKRHILGEPGLHSRVNALGEPGKVWTENWEHQTKVSAVWSADPELPIGHSKHRASDYARMLRDGRTGLICRRFSSGDDLQGGPPARGRVSSKPDGGEAAEPELVDDSIPAIVHIAEVNWVEASRFVVLKVFAFAQLEWQILPGAGLQIKAHGGRRSQRSRDSRDRQGISLKGEQCKTMALANLC